MPRLEISERDFTPKELQQMKAGFTSHGLEHGNPPEATDRFSFIATVGDSFIGCSSALAHRKELGYCDWLYLTDLYVVKASRHAGIGSRLLKAMEQKAMLLGIPHIWTWTAGYEAPEFYMKHGYAVFIEMDNWYTSGHARIGLRKDLVHATQQADAADGLTAATDL